MHTYIYIHIDSKSNVNLTAYADIWISVYDNKSNMIHLMAIDISSANIQYSGLNIATQ